MLLLQLEFTIRNTHVNFVGYMAFLNLWVNSLADLNIVYRYSFILNYDVLVLGFIHGF